MSEKLTDIGSKLLFFRLELKKLEDADLAAKLKDPALAKYGPWLRDLRVFRPHQLSDELEKSLHEKYGGRPQPPGRACSTRPSPAALSASATRC